MPAHLAEILETYGTWTPALERQYVAGLQRQPTTADGSEMGVESKGQREPQILAIIRSQPKRDWTHQEIADAAGCEASTVRHAVSRLKAKGFVELRRVKRSSERATFARVRYAGRV